MTSFSFYRNSPWRNRVIFNGERITSGNFDQKLSQTKEIKSDDFLFQYEKE